MKIYSSASNLFLGSIRGRVWLTIIISVLIVAFTFHSFPRSYSAQYCSSGASQGTSDNKCSLAQVTKYGFPIKGSVVKIGSATSSGLDNFDGFTFAANFICVFVVIYELIRLIGLALSK
jgi:hypothetical protein